jgi:hypothetical protein
LCGVLLLDLSMEPSGTRLELKYIYEQGRAPYAEELLAESVADLQQVLFVRGCVFVGWLP